MILILSREDDGHVPLVVEQLAERGAEYLWFDPGTFPRDAEISLRYDARGLSSSRLRAGDRWIDLGRVEAVWYRRPGRPEATPEVQGAPEREWVARECIEFLEGLWETMDCLWIPGRPLAVEGGYNKVSQLALAGRLGFQLPRTLIGNSSEALLDFYAECDGDLITKMLRPFHLKRSGEDFNGYTHRLRRRDLAAYHALRHAPAILQEYVPKRVELRVTVVGSQVFAVEIHSQESRLTRHDWRHYDNDRATYAPHQLPPEVEARCLSLLKAMGLRFGAIDLILTPKGQYVFVEINPNGQWGWIEELTGLPLAAAIAEELCHATSSEAGRDAHAARR